jgi:membrane protein DedA with SNARE-associated domain
VPHHAHLAALAPSILSMLSRIWVYVTLGATSIIIEELAPVVAGFAAHQHHLGFVRAVLACAIGSWAAGILLYALGRWRALHVVRRWPSLFAQVEKLLGAVRRHPWRASLATRYVYGARFFLPIACGAAEVPWAGYAIGSAISAATWSLLFTLVGWAFGSTAVLVLGRIRRHEDALAVVLVAIIALLVLVITLRNREKVPTEIDDGLLAFTRGEPPHE